MLHIPALGVAAAALKDQKDRLVNGASHISQNGAATSFLMWVAGGFMTVIFALSVWVVATVNGLDKGKVSENDSIVQLAKDQDQTTQNIGRLADKMDQLANKLTDIQIADGSDATKLSDIDGRVTKVEGSEIGIWRDIAAFRGELAKRGIYLPMPSEAPR